MGCKIAALKLLIIVPNLFYFISGCYMVYKGTQGLIEYGKYGDKEDLRGTNTEATLAVALAAGLLQCIVSFLAF